MYYSGSIILKLEPSNFLYPLSNLIDKNKDLNNIFITYTKNILKFIVQ